MRFRATFRGDREFVEALRAAARQGVRDAAVEAVGRAAIDVQQRMREHVERLIYSQPPSPNYTRTGRLRRSVHAARPDADHSSDHNVALAQDLAADDPREIAAQVQGGMVGSEVGSWTDYSEPVHEGVNQPSPRPFVEDAVPDAEQALERRMREHIERWLTRL